MFLSRLFRHAHCCLILIGQLAIVSESVSGAALEASKRLTEELRLYQDQLVELESEHGPYDRRLLEPLAGLGELLTEAGDYEEAERLLNRQLQLHHIAEGPTTLAQVPVLVALIDFDLRRQDWQAVTDRFQHIHWLHRQHPEVDTATLLDTLNDVRAWHLASLYFDVPQNRALHVDESREIQAELLSLATTRYGRGSEELIPWLYSFAVERYHVTAFLESTGDLVAGSRNNIPRGPTLNLIQRIQRITEAGDDLEALAMATLYLADFQMLRRERAGTSITSRVPPSNRGNAARTYRQAMDLLLEAGVEQARIDEFFARPVALPVTHFHFSLEDALAHQEEGGYSLEQTSSRNSVHMGDVIVANNSLPFAHFSTMPELADSLNADLHAVELKLTIDSVGKSRNLKALESEPNSVAVRNDARDAIEQLQFRPCFIEGRWRRIRDVTMRYLFPPEYQGSPL